MAFPSQNKNYNFECLLIKSMFREEMFQTDEFTGENFIFV